MASITVEPIVMVDSKTMEEVKKLRTNINFLNAKAINITSVTSGEGKSMISFLLAEALSEIDKKVILVDADIRKNNKNNIYNVKHNEGGGLSEFLRNMTPKEDAIYKSNYKNLDFILSGNPINNAAELLNNSNMADLIQFCRDNYDYIIIDTPPAGEVTDAAIIAAYTDGTILIVEAGMTDYNTAVQVKNQLENSGTRLLGVVLNKV